MAVIKYDFWGNAFTRTHSLNPKLELKLRDFGITYPLSKIYAYDFEVFPNMWLVNFTNVLDRTESFFIINDRQALMNLMNNNRKDMFVGYNCKGYDQWIAKAIILGASNNQVYELSQKIVTSKKTKVKNPDGTESNVSDFAPWAWEFFKYKKMPTFTSYDVMLDIMGVISLKKYEFKLGMNIEECDIPWDYSGTWTNEMLCDVAKYCQYDVLSTIEVLHRHKEDITSKAMIHNLFPYVSLADCFNKTSTQLATKVVKAQKRELIQNYIEIPADLRLRDEKLIEKYTSAFQLPLFERKMFGTTCKYGSGGVHGAIKNSTFHTDDEYIILNSDVGSYYPNIIRLKNMMSRCVPLEMVQAYADMISIRLKAKANGEALKALALKLILNKLYGSFGSKFQDTYDRQALFGVCALGQLYLSDLMERLYDATNENIQFINVNTDGVMYRFKKADFEKVYQALEEWQQRTGFGLEHEVIKSMYQRDVNNYVEVRLFKKDSKFKDLEEEIEFVQAHNVHSEGVKVKIKAKGSQVNNWNGDSEVNTNCTAIQKAIVNHLVYQIPIESTFKKCEMHDFALCVSAGKTYEGVYHNIGNEWKKVNFVNRCYAVTDSSYGQIMKRNAKTGNLEHLKKDIPHILIDNAGVRNDVTILNMSYYKEKALEQIELFSEKPAIKKTLKIK